MGDSAPGQEPGRLTAPGACSRVPDAGPVLSPRLGPAAAARLGFAQALTRSLQDGAGRAGRRQARDGPPPYPGREEDPKMTSTTRRPVSWSERAERRQQRQAKLEQLHAQLAEQVAALVDSEKWRAMLRAAARFHDYSANNVLLILAHRPDATRVAGYRTWQALGRQVIRGERGIAILAPITYRITDDDRADAKQTGKETTSARRLAGFTVEHVWDISQTTGEPLPEVRPSSLVGEAPAGLADGLVCQLEGEGYTVRDGVCHAPRATGQTDPMTRTGTVRAGLPAAQRAKTLAHELGHIRLGHVHDLPSYDTCRGRCEVEAESVAFLVCAQAGLDSADYSVAYAAGWAGGDPAVLRRTADQVIAAARAISDALVPSPIAT
jgi:antirestriction factor ArdC-like protein